jgi:hypothetical protein
VGPEPYDPTISRIDPVTNTVVDTITTVPRPFVVRTAIGEVWSGDFAGTKVWRFHVTA